MRLSPWLERAVAYLILNHPDKETVFDVDRYNAGTLYLDLCDAQVNEIWDVGSFRTDSYITTPASFLYSVPTLNWQHPHLYLSQPHTFTPTKDFMPASWRVRWVEHDPEGEPEEWPEGWVAEEIVLLAGDLAESGELRANVPYTLLPTDFHLYFLEDSIGSARGPFACWFFDLFLLQLGTTDVYDELTWMFFKDTEWFDPDVDYPPPFSFPPIPPYLTELNSTNFDFDSQGGTLRNKTDIVFPTPWINQACNILCVYRQFGNADPIQDVRYFFIGTISEPFVWSAGLTVKFLPGTLTVNVA